MIIHKGTNNSHPNINTFKCWLCCFNQIYPFPIFVLLLLVLFFFYFYCFLFLLSLMLLLSRVAVVATLFWLIDVFTFFSISFIHAAFFYFSLTVITLIQSIVEEIVRIVVHVLKVLVVVVLPLLLQLVVVVVVVLLLVIVIVVEVLKVITIIRLNQHYHISVINLRFKEKLIYEFILSSIFKIYAI